MALLVPPTRLLRSAIVLKPSTLLAFHKAEKPSSAMPLQRALPVVRQNFSRDRKRGSSWWSRQTIIGSIQQEDSGGGQPACAWSAHIYKDRSKIDPDYAARL